MAPQRDCCAPGDITVTVVPTGFMLGRVLPPRGRGTWWSMIQTFGSLREAVGQARRLARANGASAWFQIGVDGYERIPLDDSEFVP